MKAAVVVLFAALPALAYNEAVHVRITQAALADPTPIKPPTQEDFDAFRALFWKVAAAHPDFLRRYPAAESFGAWELKEFLMLDPAAAVHGFDAIPDDAAAKTRGELLVLASRWPDDDERNRHRYLRDARTHEIIKARDGSPLPYDPGTLDFGSLSGTTSQGHAHYGLVDEPLSDDPVVLKKEPWRFAVPKTAHAYGVEFIQIYTDLARLAERSGLRSAPWLSAVFAGAAFHHLEDVCNQIHTVQVGIYEFFESAFLQSKLQDLKTLGGLFGRRYSLEEIGLRLIANHHLLSEDLYARHFRLPQNEPPALDARAIIALSSREAPEIYRLAWRFSAKTLRDGIHGHEYDGAKGDDPDAYVDQTQSEAIARFYDLEEKGVLRAIGAVRAWSTAGEHDPVPMLLEYHAQAAQRRASYHPRTAAKLGIAWGYPAAAAALIALVVWLFAKRKKRAPS